MEQLNPCPFCGGKAHIGVYYDFYRVGCSTSTCQAHLPEIFNGGSTDNNWYGSIPEAIEAWNTRYESTCDLYVKDNYYHCDRCDGSADPNESFCAWCGARIKFSGEEKCKVVEE